MAILVLEDEFLIALAAEDVLRDAGARRIGLAKTIAEAHELLCTRFDAAILDVRVPDGYSYGLAEALCSQKVGVTFHSGHTDYADAERFPKAVFCPKPSPPDQLVSSVLTSLARVRSWLNSLPSRSQR
ncbi:MAG: response regulator [Pseudomonadota bacterium]